MSAEFQSSNPFRRKGNAAALSPNPTSPIHSATFIGEPFSNNASAGETPADAAEPEPPKRKKVVKRVRVQTPPPLSSDSESDGPVGAQSPIERRWGSQDPFEGSQAEGPVDTPAESGPPRRNPFSKTLHDIEPGKNLNENKTSARTPGRASLDVAAFSRLLLTGQAGADNPTGGSPSEGTISTHTPPDLDTESDSSLLPAGRSPVDARHNPNANPAPSEPPRTRNPEPEAAPLIRANEPAAGPKKKPPPPSSRHGKAIRLQLGGDDKARQHPAPPTPPLTRTPSDFNKPLPPAPLRSPEEEEAESVFDREAAGRVPEGSEPPSPAVSGYEVQGIAKRVTPAPPPRRNRDGEGRSGVGGSPAHVPEPQRRGSVESTHSRAESIRQSAPVPPPPRRPTHRSTSSITSPPSQPYTTSPNAAPNHPSSPRGPIPDPMNPKLAPPPPPARNASTRRKTSNNSIDSTKRAGKEREAAPPPPPRRQRGGSRSSLDSLSEGSRRVGDNGAGVDTLKEEEEVKVDDGQAGAILADLESLQREVDALQKQYASASR